MKKKIYLMSSIFFLVDLLSKLLIIKFEDNLPLVIINNFFSIIKVTNEGAAFSMFNGYSIILALIAVLVLIYIHKYLLKDIKTKYEIISYSLLIGGIIGNLLDRIIYGKVTDFLSFNIFGYMFPIFNLADTFICIGVFLIIINLIKGGKHGTKSNRK